MEDQENTDIDNKPKKSFKILLNGQDYASWGGTDPSTNQDVTFYVDLKKILNYEDLNKVYNMSFSFRRNLAGWYGNDHYIPTISFQFSNNIGNNVLMPNRYVTFGTHNLELSNLRYKTDYNNKNGTVLPFGEISLDTDNRPLQISNLLNLTGIRYTSSRNLASLQTWVANIYVILTFTEA